MKKEEVLTILEDKGFVLDKEKSFDHGVQLVFRNGAKVSVYHTGSVNPQGKHVNTVNELLGRGAPQRALAVTVRDTRRLFYCSVRRHEGKQQVGTHCVCIYHDKSVN